MSEMGVEDKQFILFL